MFGIDAVKSELSLILRDTNDTYCREIQAAWEECCRNLPREGFTQNQEREMIIPLKAGQSIIHDCAGIIQIRAVKVLLSSDADVVPDTGGVWVFLSRVEPNSTDIFTLRNTPQSVPMFYEYFGEVLKIFPAAGYATPLVITANYGSGQPIDPCCKLDDRLFTFCRNYCLVLLYNLFQLGSRDDMLIAQQTLQSERAKLWEVRRRQTARGVISEAW